MKKLPLYISLLLLITCAKEDSQAPNTPPTQIVKQYALTASAGEGGSVSGGGTYASGTQVSLTATPSSGYSFSGWSNGSTANPLTVTLNSNTSITANFQVIVNSYTLTVSAAEGGSVSSEGGEYEEGTEVTITATPNEGYEFTGWSDGDTSLERLISVSENLTLTAEFERIIIYFSHRYPNYSDLNKKSGTILNNMYSVDSMLSVEYIASELDIYEDCDCQGCGCNTRFIIRNYRFFDYNNDDRPDFFAWLANASMSNTPGRFSEKGKYVIVEDVFNDPEKYYFDSERYYDGRSILGDFNNDGYDEILVFSSEDHDNDAGSPVSDKIPLSILKYNGNGDLSISPIGPNTSNHDLVVLDIDNDNDLDIINYEWYMFEYESHEEVPLIYLNDGSGNFSVTSELVVLFDEYYDDPGDFVRTATDSFDIDNDGYLDVVSGTIFPSNQPQEYRGGAEVIWGNPNIKLNYNNSTKLNIDLYSEFSKEYLGFNFIDYNNDSYYDIVAVGDTGTYEGGFIDIYKNNGDRTFTQVTSEIVDMYLWKARRTGGDIPIFYEIEVFDVDNDGDYDLRLVYDTYSDQINDAINRDLPAVGKNTYWENNGGVFNFKKNSYTIDPSWYEIVYKVGW